MLQTESTTAAPASRRRFGLSSADEEPANRGTGQPAEGQNVERACPQRVGKEAAYSHRSPEREQIALELTHSPAATVEGHQVHGRSQQQHGSRVDERAIETDTITKIPGRDRGQGRGAGKKAGRTDGKCAPPASFARDFR